MSLDHLHLWEAEIVIEINMNCATLVCKDLAVTH